MVKALIEPVSQHTQTHTHTHKYFDTFIHTYVQSNGEMIITGI